MSLRSLEWRRASLAKPLLVDRVLVAESDPKKRDRLLEIPTSLCGVLVESVNILHSSPSLPEAPDRAQLELKRKEVEDARLRLFNQFRDVVESLSYCCFIGSRPNKETPASRIAVFQE